MRGRILEIGWRDDDTSEALKTAYLAERDGMIRTRLHALWLLRSGWPLGAVARTVVAVRPRRMGGVGQPAWLSVEAQAEISDEVAGGRLRTAREIRDWIATRYQVRYTLGGIYSLLERLCCAPKVPRPLHAQTEQAHQEAWKKGDSPKRSVASG
jgi:hypothetical protein